MAPHSFADRKGTKKTADFQTTSAVFNNFMHNLLSKEPAVIRRQSGGRVRQDL